MREDIRLNERAKVLAPQIKAKLLTVIDPELELDIYNLGLVYEININETGHCRLVMTFTETNCGCADTLPIEVADKIKEIPEVASAEVIITYNPAWKMTRISRFGRIALRISPW